METLLVILSISAIYLLVAWLMMKQNDRKLLVKQSTRTPLTKKAFIGIYVKKGYQESIIQDLYDEVKSYVPKRFNLDPSDYLVEDYKIGISDLEELTIKYFKYERSLTPDSEDFENFNLKEKSLHTFEGVLAFIHS